jgi:hypothetical protein
MNKMKSFVKQFVSIVKGNDAEALAQKALRQADSALKSQIASLVGDTVNFEDRLEEAKEAQVSARVNHGKPITNRESYVRDLISAKNNVTLAEENLKEHKEKIAFLEAEQSALDSEE